LKLLISPKNAKEAKEAVAGGADIIDVKNPLEGALGANYPWVIREIKDVCPRNVEVSCTIGEAPNLPASVSLAAFGAASLGVDYIKVGLGGIKTPKQAVNLLQSVRRAAKDASPDVRIVAAGYADAQRTGAVAPLQIPQVAHDAEADVAMLDTEVKNGKTLFDHLTQTELGKFVDSAHGFGLQAALAGSLRVRDLPVVFGLGADVAGLRAAACTGSDRNMGEITRERVIDLVEAVRRASGVRA
jgi:uncharacterized protein (UPF0264 family)